VLAAAVAAAVVVAVDAALTQLLPNDAQCSSCYKVYTNGPNSVYALTV
jgi:uncharacterized membrane protein